MRKLQPLVLAGALGIAGLAAVTPVLAAPTVSPEVVVSSIPSLGVISSVASLNGTHLVVWRNGGLSFGARRVTADGLLLGAGPTVANTFDGYDTLRAISVNDRYILFTRNQFWFDVSEISADAVLGGQTAQAIIPYPAALYNYSTGLQAASAGGAYMFVYGFFGTTDLSGDPSGNYHGVHYLRGDDDYLPLSVWHTASPNYFDEEPMIASDGTNFMILSHHIEGWNTDEERFSIYSPQGTLLSTGVSACAGTTMAWNGDAYLVISASGQDLKGCLLDATGNKVGDVPLIGSVASTKSQPRAMWDGARTLVVWTDQRNGNYDIYGNWLKPGGAPEVAGDLAISTAPQNEVLGDISATLPGRGVVSLSYQNKVVVRYITTDLAAQGQPCNGFDCQSGHCVDGVCCDSPCGGGDPNDCQACSVAAGALADGTCTPKPDGAACDDASVCTAADTCVAGACQGSPNDCPFPPECQTYTGCDPTSGACQYTPAPDSTPCSTGLCFDGMCIGDNPGGGGAGGATGTGGNTGGDTGTVTTTSTTTLTNTPTPTATVPGGDPAENTKDTTVIAGTCTASPTSQTANLTALLTTLAIALLVSRRRRAR